MATETFCNEQVLQLRSSLRLTQVQLAEKVGVSQPLVAAWEKGERRPSGPAALLLKQLQAQAEKKSRKRS